MKDKGKTKAQLMSELIELRQRVTELETLEAKHQSSVAAIWAYGEPFRLLFDYACTGLVIASPEAQYLQVNQAFCDMVGYTAVELLGQSFASITHPEDTALNLRLYQQALRGEHSSFQLEKRFVKKDGQLIYVLYQTTLIRGSDHQPLYFIGQATDITERKQAELALQKQNRELALLNKATQAFMSTLNLEQVLTYVLEETRNLLRVTAGTIWLVDPMTNESVCWRTTVAEHQSILNWRLAPGQGIVGWVIQHGQSIVVSDTRTDPRHYKEIDHHTGIEMRSILCVPLRNQEEVIGAIQIVDTSVQQFDTADLELVELLAITAAIAIDNASLFEAILDSEKRYRSLFDNTPVALLEEDFSAVKDYLEQLQLAGVSDFRDYFEQHPAEVAHCLELVQIVNVNQAALRMYCAGSKAFFLENWSQIFGSESLAEFIEELVTVAEGRSLFSGETVHYTLTGKKIYVDVGWSVASGFEKSYKKVIVSRSDITERKNLQKQILQAQKMEAVGQLAGGLAHNFNNMLTIVMSSVGLAIDALPIDHPVIPDLQNIQKAGTRAAALIRHLLAFSRNQAVELKIVSLNKLILDMEPLFRQIIGSKIDLILNLDPELRSVKIDVHQFEQVLVNLVLNARDAMPKGGEVTLSTVNLTIDQRYIKQKAEVTPGDYVVISVADTGAGMSDEVKGHLFEPFFTTKEMGKGTGLGLATCFGIIQQNKGHILVQSEPDKGTTFEIYLPAFI
jgi:PAS domain S-box-containing protein